MLRFLNRNRITHYVAFIKTPPVFFKCNIYRIILFLSKINKNYNKAIDRLEGGEVANYENIKDANNNRTPSERRELARIAGIESGKARRRKAAMRDTMNRCLTMQAHVDGLSDVLIADGGESTYEEIITMAIINQAAMGDVKAYNAIMKVVGQTDKSDMDLENQKADTELKQARKQAVTGENESDEAIDRLDSILEELRNNAVKQETE